MLPVRPSWWTAMADGLLGTDPLVAEWDPDAGLFLVRAWTAGPAGTAGLQLGGGVELDLDVAWPSRVAELRIPAFGGAIDGDARAVVEQLLGSQRASRLVQLEEGITRQLDDARYQRHPGMTALAVGALAHQIGSD